MVSTQTLSTNRNDDDTEVDDNISSISSHSSSDDENTNELALPHRIAKEKPSFANVAVSNSTDIHFGNETLYHGPVTIKQFVYENPKSSGNSNADIEESFETKLALEDNYIPLHTKPDTTNCNDKPTLRSDTNDKIKISQDNNYINNNLQHTEVEQVTSLKSFLKKHFKKTIIISGIIIVLILAVSVTCAVLFTKTDYFVSREEWGALPPKENLTQLQLPVPFVIISHTASENCTDLKTCIHRVKTCQLFHVDGRKWSDIGYNFLVGGDGRVYEGRGWKPQGAHTYGYNNRSIGISFIGTFIDYLPPQRQILAAQNLISQGVDLKYIRKNYQLFGARQLQSTESPGIALFNNMKTWPHWTDIPSA